MLEIASNLTADSHPRRTESLAVAPPPGVRTHELEAATDE
ncbi:MAG: hypothetical protein QOI08_3548 [Actinomycetota bacterium]|jgi:hypothetical protein|nr:hypothetical protein [Actinomycetota bacterium]MDQ1478838.1 hypothetical protein [Actinomycetota bacterium]